MAERQQKIFAGAAIGLGLLASGAQAGGIDRSGLFLGPLFEEGGEHGAYVSLSYGEVDPDANNMAAGVDPLKSYDNFAFAYKQDLGDQLSFALILDEPFGVATDYRPSPIPARGILTSEGITGVLRYAFDDTWAVHAGLRGVALDGEIFGFPGGLPGLMRVSSDYDMGYLVGFSYERPDIALRVAVTYNSEIDHGLSGTETNVQGASIAPTSFTTTTPESLNIEFQTGIAADTLLFGSIRHARWAGFNVTSPGMGMYSFLSDNSTSYTLGVGRRFNDNWSGSIRIGYEPTGTRPSSTALKPTTGLRSIGIGAEYAAGNGFEISAGYTYFEAGDQSTRSAAIGNSSDNDGSGFGVRIGYSF